MGHGDGSGYGSTTVDEGGITDYQTNEASPVASMELRSSAADEMYAKEDPEDFAKQIMSLVYPVSLTMFMVVYLTRTFGGSDTQGGLDEVMVYHENDSDSTGDKLGGSILNMLIFIGFLCVATSLMAILYKCGCVRVIYAWLLMSVVILLGFFTMYIVQMLLELYNVPLDQVSFYLLIWNWAAVGVLAIFWHSPLWVKQGYLTALSAMMAWTLTRLPEWTTWGVLIGVSLWDIFAVLAPMGPLKSLLKESQTRNQPIPGLVYDTSQHTVVDRATRQAQQAGGRASAAHNTSSSTRSLLVGGVQDTVDVPLEDLATSSASVLDGMDERRLPRDFVANQAEELYEEPESTVKLGLGDFIFYSLLLARAAMLETWPTIATCFLALQSGLALTLFFLAWLQKPLPALPISIGLGFLFYFSTQGLIDPFLKVLLERQIFI